MNARPSPADELAGVFAGMSGMFLTQQTVDTALATITSLATDTVEGSTGSGVTLLSPAGRPTTSAATHPLVRQLDDLQYQQDDGPCLSAWRARTVVRSVDLPNEQRWRRWSLMAAELGMRSVLSAPLSVGDKAIGALKVYSTATAAYDERDEDLLRRFAEQAAIFVSNAQTAQAAEQLSDSLKETLRSRDTIATARGIVMAQQEVDADEAYRRLTELSYRRREPIRALAQRMVESLRRP
ncbi:GAF and ANTAR domain-containing protein [Mycobacterium sp. MYCO198283]|uniref:GAF and ANTAR domain-containing protein n=1 Tax=Mycobacterium sp. MYCO198283 TaxID=2883505 RepID=UPI001E2D97F0|nr:GAF and ANTAR domain-containing protein [Mycobacterium sp. MYCO198283]MCG5434044.1 GAF and ANTAR domain-containing protein [Mycobacterium sp. MYCO198283]